MSAEVNIYETIDCLDTFSKGGTYLNPIFRFPPDYFRGDLGQTRDVQVFLRNDGNTLLGPLPDEVSQICPIDLSDTDESTWVKLATTQAGLEYSTPGACIDLPEIEPAEKFPFWIRCTVPAGIPEEDKRDVRIQINTWAIPIIGYLASYGFEFSYDIAAKANNLRMWYDIEAL